MKKSAPKKTSTLKKTKKAEKSQLGKSFTVALPLSKVSEGPNGELYVEGFLARVDTPDKTPGMPEQMDEALSTPNFLKWVADTQQRSNGLSMFNAREMHSAKAAGRGIEFKHVEGVGYWGKSEVVDSDTKEKVRKGVITSHSIGGQYGRTWIKDGVLHYEGKPIEVSYVDVPMIPGTEFQFQHANGEIEMRKFQNVTPEAPTAKDFIAHYAALRKDGGVYEISPEYARSEAWDTAAAAQVLAQAAQLMSSEANEPEDAAELAAIYRGLLNFIQGEVNEMEAAATGTPSADDVKCPACGADMEADMKFCPMCGEAMNKESEAEPEPEAETTEEPEMNAENDGAPEAEEGDEAEGEEEEDSEEVAKAVGLTEEDVKKIVREVIAEANEANKAAMNGELSKAMTPVSGQLATLQKSQQALAGNLEKLTKDFSSDIAEVVKGHNTLEAHVNAMQKTVESYGPVVRVAPRGGQESPSNMPPASQITEKDMLKALIASPKTSAMMKQTYQAQLTELEIREGKPLEEPPTFIG